MKTHKTAQNPDTNQMCSSLSSNTVYNHEAPYLQCQRLDVSRKKTADLSYINLYV